MHPGSSSDVIDVWRVRLDTDPGVETALTSMLSPDESARAQRFVFDRDRRRFTIARGALRRLLSRCLNCEPARLAFAYGPHGKPSLAEPSIDIRFNVSHTHDLALIAVTHGRDLGIDVEFIRPLEDRDQLVASNFSPHEIAEYRSIPPAHQEAAFFAGWTRKEAYVKARGGGLSIPLESVTVPLAADAAPALLEVAGDPAESARWQIADLSVDAGYAGALVAEGTGWRIEYRHWSG